LEIICILEGVKERIEKEGWEYHGMMWCEEEDERRGRKKRG